MAAQSKALKNFKEQCKRRQQNLADPAWGGSHEGRAFPRWEPGMSTFEYVRRFQNLSPMKPCGYVFAPRVAAMLDPFEPEVVEERDS